MTDLFEADIMNFCTAIEAACVDLKQRIAERHGIIKEAKSTVSEENFSLKYTEHTSQKLGTFEVAEEKGNILEKWTSAFNILRQSNATISYRYHGENYSHSYWIWNSKIYRQKLKK